MLRGIKRPVSKPHHNRGVALVTALLVVALATTAAVTMTSRQQLDIRRSANLLQSDQILLYARGVEAWAGQVLRRDREDGDRDHLGEDWATVLPPLPVDNGQVAGFMEDRQGRFNLNNLINEGKPDSLALERFRRLLQAVELDPELANALLDWLDDNIDPTFPAGAEDDYYLALEQPYRAGNRLMASSSELLLVEGFGYEGYSKLAPYVAALPERTVINVNTAPATVLMILAEGLSKDEAEKLAAARGEDGFGSVADLLKHEVLAGRELSSEELGVASDYFMVISDIRIGRVQQRYYSLLNRSAEGNVRTVMHAAGML